MRESGGEVSSSDALLGEPRETRRWLRWLLENACESRPQRPPWRSNVAAWTFVGVSCGFKKRDGSSKVARSALRKAGEMATKNNVLIKSPTMNDCSTESMNALRT